MTKTVEIGYLSDTAKDYSSEIKNVSSLTELRKLVRFYSPLTDDAIALADRMTEADFEQFKIDRKKLSRARGKTAEYLSDKWGDIVLPSLMLKVGLVAAHFHTPFGVAYIRMKEMGQL